MIKVEATPENGRTVKQEVTEDINQFDVWFQKRLNNAKLTRSERAIINDYLGWKIEFQHGAKENDHELENTT